MNRPVALPLRPGNHSRRVAHLAPGDPTTLLTRDRRERWRAHLDQGADLDVLVVGGGITGVGVALDAASRGLRVALVERADLGAGTSGWSSKLVHGGHVIIDLDENDKVHLNFDSDAATRTPARSASSPA